MLAVCASLVSDLGPLGLSALGFACPRALRARGFECLGLCGPLGFAAIDPGTFVCLCSAKQLHLIAHVLMILGRLWLLGDVHSSV